MVGLRGRDFVDAAQTIFKAAIGQPEIAVKQWVSFLGDLGKVAAGESARAVEPGDKRFNDPAWKTSGLHQRLLQSYLAWGEAIHAFLDKVDLDAQDRARAKLIADILVDALSPTNSLVLNPAALKKLIDRRAAHAGDVEDHGFYIAHLAHERLGQFDIGADAVEQEKRRTVLGPRLDGDPQILAEDAHHASVHRAAAASDRFVPLMKTLSLRVFAVTH